MTKRLHACAEHILLDIHCVLSLKKTYMYLVHVPGNKLKNNKKKSGKGI